MNEALRQSQMAAKRQVEEGLRLNSVATRALQDEQLNTSKDWTMPQCHRLKMCKPFLGLVEVHISVLTIRV